MKNQALLPEGWPRTKGYANGVAATGRQLFVAGQIGWSPEGVFPSDDFAAQTRPAHTKQIIIGANPCNRCLRNRI
jgi:enamine deaminase RidA (YjgF/YER057c/UK114 family)